MAGRNDSSEGLTEIVAPKGAQLRRNCGSTLWANTPRGFDSLSRVSTAHTAQPGSLATKKQLSRRLARIEGQVHGVARMIDEDRSCIDVLTQISAIHAALDKVGLGLLDRHARVYMHPDSEQAGATTDPVDELIGAVERLLGR